MDPDLAGDVDWPKVNGKPVPRGPDGIEHHAAPLALLELDAAGTWRRVADCRTVFPPLGGLLDLEYAGGDGQETLPGEVLPQPLQIAVSDGSGPAAGVTVRFTAEDAGGRLAGSAADLAGSTSSTLDAATGPDGLARCFWRPADDLTRPSQRVSARRVGPNGPEGAPVDFAAQLSLAERVGFAPRDCAALAGATTVQDALDLLVVARSLVEVGGNGQAGRPGGDLPRPVEVLVRSGCGPVEGAAVRFGVDTGAVGAAVGDLPAGASTVEVTTGPDGIARCAWRLGPDDPDQVLVAELVAGDAPVAPPTRLALTASVESGHDDAAGLHVTGVALLAGGRELPNDALVAAPDLVGGLGVVLDGRPDPATVTGKPVLGVTLDLPYPLSESDRTLWGSHPAHPARCSGRCRSPSSGTWPWATSAAARRSPGRRAPARPTCWAACSRRWPSSSANRRCWDT